MIEYPPTEPQFALAASAKPMIGSLGLKGLVLSALVSGEYPKTHPRLEARMILSILEERAWVASVALQKMERQMREATVTKTFFETPDAIDYIFQPEDEALVLIEYIVNYRMCEWLGPFTVAQADESEKQVYVQMQK